MSVPSRSSQPSSPETTRNMFAKAEKELGEGFVEVEITGLSFRRFVSVYAVLVHYAWMYTMGSVRSLLRVDTAHQA